MNIVLNTSEKDLGKTESQASVSSKDGEPTKATVGHGTSVFVVERVVNGSVCTVKSSASSSTCEPEKISKQPVEEITIDCADNSESDVQIIANSVIDESLLEKDKFKKGPLPGLLPLENLAAQNSLEGRMPRIRATAVTAVEKFAVTEKIKVMAPLLNFTDGKRGIDVDKPNVCNDEILNDSLQDHMIIEPDIEIHTLSDEYQMEFEDADPNSPGGSNVPAEVCIDQVEKAVRETLCCWSCTISLIDRTNTLLWESMEFCSEKCLKTYVKVIGSHCNMCNSQVAESILGKLCVRFGTVIRQFCAAECLEKFKSSHKLCATCQVNMMDKDKLHCSPNCEELSRRLANKSYFYGRRFCAVCNELKEIQEEVYFKGRSNWLCSKPCLNAFRYSHKITTLSCEMCSRGFDVNVTPRFVSRNTDPGVMTPSTQLSWYCSSVCFAINLLKKRKIELCARCQVKKYNVDMIRKPAGDKSKQDKGQLEAQMLYFCSIYCFTHYVIPIREAPRRKVIETASQSVTSSVVSPPTVSSKSSIVESSVRSVISTPLNPMPPQTTIASTLRPIMVYNLPAASQVSPLMNTLQHVTSSVPATNQPSPVNTTILPIELQHKIVFVPPKPKEMKNKSVWCRPSSFKEKESAVSLSEQSTISSEKPVEVPESPKIVQCETGTSTDEERKPLYIPIPIPIPVPIYVPVPMAMYNFPVPYPIPMPIVTPLIFPVGSNLLAEMMKAIAAGGWKQMQVDSETPQANDTPALEAVDCKNGLKSTDVTENHDHQSDELENVIEIPDGVNFELEIPHCSILFRNGARKRSHSTSHFSLPMPKRSRDITGNKSSSDSEESIKTSRSDSPSLHLTVTGCFQKEVGVKAWTEWMKRKGKKNPDISKLCETSVVDVNISLVAFVEQIKKPDGDRYRPDVLLYFISGLQESLSFGADFRRQNLLMDAALLPFQIELDKHLQPFYDAVLKGINSDSTMEMLTCLKESHLWKCRQLGVDSPIVLVFTILYFNTKYFRLYTAEQHLQMSFGNIQMKTKKSVASTSGVSNGTAGKNITKIFALQFENSKTEDSDADPTPDFKRKKPMEMPQNIDCLNRCPVKIHNFYVSKCPEESKTRKDMFYLLPETACAPDSPVWYSSQPVPREVLARMLRRVLLVEEVLHNLCSLD